MIDTDALIVGAGPVGLFQVFELGLLEIKAHVVDSLAVPGGQCIELYPDKPIYDIPAVPRSTGRELVDSLLKQIEPFGATFHLGQEVTAVSKQADGRFLVETSKGTQFLAKTVFVAGGVGSFQPRKLKVDGLDKYEGTQLFHHVKTPADFAGARLGPALRTRRARQGRERDPAAPARRLPGGTRQHREDARPVRRDADAVHRRPDHRPRRT
jgi:thioredoxin reductase (NADPH)